MVKSYQNYGAKPASFKPSCRPDTYSSQLAPEQRQVCVQVGRILAAIGDDLNQLAKESTEQGYVVTAVEASLKLKALK